MVVDEQSEMLIDGFTRSACVYAAIAFQLAQPKPVRLAHLLHAPSHIIEGLRRGVPTLVTVREPRGAVLSCIQREPHTTIPQLLRAHERFYRTLIPYKHGFVVGEFSRVTMDLGGLIEEVNDRFGTTFARFEGTVDEIADVFRLIEERASRPPWERHIGEVMSGLAPVSRLDRFRNEPAHDDDGPVSFDDRVARPSAARAARAEQLAGAYFSPEHADLRRRAEETYQQFTTG